MPDKDSPIAALLLKLKKGPKPEAEGDDYDSTKEAKRVQAKRLLKAIKMDDPDKAADAIREIIDLYEPNPSNPGDDEDSDY